MSDEVISDDEYAQLLAADLKAYAQHIPDAPSYEQRRDALRRAAGISDEKQLGEVLDEMYLQLARSLIDTTRQEIGDAAFEAMKREDSKN
jgi:hypothetical protein